MGHTWVLSAPDGPHLGPMNLAIRVGHHWVRWMLVTNRTETVALDHARIALNIVPIYTSPCPYYVMSFLRIAYRGEMMMLKVVKLLVMSFFPNSDHWFFAVGVPAEKKNGGLISLIAIPIFFCSEQRRLVTGAGCLSPSEYQLLNIHFNVVWALGLNFNCDIPEASTNCFVIHLRVISCSVRNSNAQL